MIKKTPTKIEKQFAIENQKAFNKYCLDGWTLEEFQKLPLKEQEYLLQFAREYTGGSSKKNRKLMSDEQLKERWAQKKKFERNENGIQIINQTEFTEFESKNNEDLE